ncbi:DUF2892 domain-containing protein [Piscinibacter sp. HJYY11]|uniref:YgaP family membrane protein n=1 Tax=Piscinibacter sp. HJYY11 TaxID=2801333 RepID=UPI00191FABDB|nr:DUF2892 domain-containing protein [Piscinibacter sp. HJYY11]MBL0726610.1 DUF2892 domain-containing protein [Piscinibacter sp. HJYY11]
MTNLVSRMMTTRNVGTLDRFARALPSVAVASFVYTGQLQGAAAWVLGIISAMLLVTSLTGSCSIYYLLGFSTCPISGKPRS